MEAKHICYLPATCVHRCQSRCAIFRENHPIATTDTIRPLHCHLRYINVGYDPSGRLMNFQCLSPCVFQKVLQLHLSKGFTILSFEGFVFKKVCQLHLSTGFTIVSFKRFIFQKISQYRCVSVKTFIFQIDYLSNGFIVSFNWFYNASLHCCTTLYK